MILHELNFSENCLSFRPVSKDSLPLCSAMRLLFVALMIALLPLRGWVGDAMAMTPEAHAMPASHPGHTPVVHADLADCHGHADMADCHGHPGMAHADHGTPEAHDAHAATDCGSCSACQICHSVALAPMLPAFAADVQPASAPQSATRELASAERAPGYKPPIS